MPWFPGFQARAVDAIKAHALGLSLRSPRARRAALTEYLHVEEGAESMALTHALTESARQAGASWIEKLLAHQLADEARHAALLRELLGAAPAGDAQAGPGRGLARLASIKLRWFERVCERHRERFAAGPLVVSMAAAAQAEATGVRVFARHLAVLDEAAARGAGADAAAEVLRAILADERRHARSCAAAADRLVDEHERPALARLRRELVDADRAFGITISVGYWLVTAARAAQDRLASALALALAPAPVASSRVAEAA
jgi:ferritin-like metal-binding protein YciE